MVTKAIVDAHSTGAMAPNALKLARVHGMASVLIDELHHGELDQPSRARLERLTFDSLVEMGSAVPDDLLGELHRLMPPGGQELASQDELRVVWAQILGWVKGLAAGERFDDVRAIVQDQQKALLPASGKRAQARVAEPYL